MPNILFLNLNIKTNTDTNIQRQLHLSGNTYPKDSNGEIDYVAYESKSYSKQDYIDMYFFENLVIFHHYHN